MIVTDWGGPSGYVSGEEGMKVAARSREELVQGFTAAMRRLAGDSTLRAAMGEAGLRRVAEPEFDWEQRTDWMLDLLGRVVQKAAPRR